MINPEEVRESLYKNYGGGDFFMIAEKFAEFYDNAEGNVLDNNEVKDIVDLIVKIVSGEFE
jgi:hypothetical protein